jgi:DHA1 family tetracycline resistance protein-like MFS transporter
VTKAHALIFILITVLLDSIGFGIVLPVMPQLIMDVTGEGISQAARYGGWLLFVYSVMQFFFAPVLGNLSDRFGRRPVLLVSLVIFAIDYLVMGWAPTVIWLFVGRIIAGMAAGTYGIANAYIADVFPPEERAQNFGLIGATFGCGFIFGPVIGGFLGELGPRVPFYATAGLTLANALYGLLVLPESLKRENRRRFELRRANPVGAINQLWRHPGLLGFVAVLFLYLLGHHALPATWSYYMIAKFGWTSSEIGFSLGAVGFTMLIAQGFLIRVAIRRLGPERTAYVGMTSAALAFIGYALAPYGWTVYCVMLVGAVQGFVSPAVQGIMSSRIPANAQGELQGAVGSVTSLAAIVGPPFMTQLFAYFSSDVTATYFPGAAFAAAAIITILSFTLLIRVIGAARTTVELPS